MASMKVDIESILTEISRYNTEVKKHGVVQLKLLNTQYCTINRVIPMAIEAIVDQFYPIQRLQLLQLM